MRKKYPNGVSKNHPAYRATQDRDKDGWACELSR
ncbi:MULTISPECIES: excalibur calcium-binding domain-containing protein [Staphylococcus]|nr:excalibur calcium-binding domain-containing protein [Staphylococcus sp. acrmy]